MKKKTRIILIITGIIVALLIAAGLVTSYADSARVRNGVEPKFTIRSSVRPEPVALNVDWFFI